MHVFGRPLRRTKGARALPTTWKEAQIWWAVLVALTATYAVTAHWFGIGNSDTLSPTFVSWEFVHHGTLYVEGDASRPSLPGLVPVHGHIVASGMPGVFLAAIPMQALLAPLHLAWWAGGVLTAVLATSLALANLTLLLLRLGAPLGGTLAAVVALALGTGFWPNASAELWTHGLDALWLSCAMLALQRRRDWLAGAALGPAMWTRPHLSLVAASIGIALALQDRSLRPLARIGLPTCLALIGLRQWNGWLLGRASIEGNYAGYLGHVTDARSTAWHDFAVSMSGSLISPLRGLLVNSPFVLLAAVAAARGMRQIPAWARGALVGGVFYQIAQWRLSAFTGGSGYYSYRYPLELLVLATPAAVCGYVVWRRQAIWLRPAMRLLVGAAVATHFVGVFWYRPFTPLGQDQDPWRTWGFWFAAHLRGPTGLAAALAASAIIMIASQVPLASVARAPGRVRPLGRSTP